jgi:hypothetical protein
MRPATKNRRDGSSAVNGLKAVCSRCKVFVSNGGANGAESLKFWTALDTMAAL